jgi:hypothetical protein
MFHVTHGTEKVETSGKDERVNSVSKWPIDQMSEWEISMAAHVCQGSEKRERANTK